MIPVLYNKQGTTQLGILSDCIECFAEEERNGLLEIKLIYPNDDLATHLINENIIVCDVNDILKDQQFRIYDTLKLMNNQIEVLARHISFDLAYDAINDIDIQGQSCEYALNAIFRNSHFSTSYKGYSDIVNTQDFKISQCSCLQAIAGERGSIIDTYGTGAEILRDNTNIHVLNKRGADRGVAIEYAKNLTGFELEEDAGDLVTRIIPYAKYTDEDKNEIRVEVANGVDSPLIGNYSHPYIQRFDYTEKFEEGETPTEEALITLALREYEENNKDKIKQNFQIEFIPLSKCVGYEGLEDKISLCDTVTIIDTRYNIDTKAKVIKTIYNVLKDKYESMELGEPRTTLSDIINQGTAKGEKGDKGDKGEPGKDGNLGDFSDSLPATPILTGTVRGFGSIELSWTYEAQVYYQYEIYASTIAGFTPNTFDLIHRGQTSSFLFNAEPNQTWYFRACAINTYGKRTDFSPQLVVETTKVDNLQNYFTTAAIGRAVVASLTADYMTAGVIKGNWIDARNLTVTDGNGIRTLNIDSAGKVSLNVNEFKIQSQSVSESMTNLENNLTKISDNLSKNYSTTTQMDSAINQKANSILSTVSSTYISHEEYESMDLGTRNLLRNTNEGKTLTGNNTENQIIKLYDINDPSLLAGKTATLTFKYKLSNWNGEGGIKAQTGYTRYDQFKQVWFQENGIKNGTHTYTSTITFSSDNQDTELQLRADWLGGTVEILPKTAILVLSNKKADWSQAPEDIIDNISSVEQTAKKINWLVKSGSSESNMVLTDKMLEIVSNKVKIEAPKVELTGSIKIGKSEDGSRSAFEVTNSGIVGIGDTINQNGASYPAFRVYYNGNLRIGGLSAVTHSGDGIQKGVAEITSLGTIYSCSTTDAHTYTQIAEGAIIVNNTSYNSDHGYFLDKKIVMQDGEIYITSYTDNTHSTRAKEIAINGNKIYSNMYDYITIDERLEVSKHMVITTNAKAYRGVDTSGTHIALAHIGGDNVSRFGYGSWNTDSNACYNAGTEYLGGYKATLKAKDSIYLGCNSSKYIRYFRNSDGNYVFRPDDENKNIMVGTSTYPWKSVTAVSVTQTSDRTLKENIKYISNANTINDDNVTLHDCYEFIKNDLPIATYNYKEDETKSDKIGFIAQDLLCNADGSDNKVGQLIIDRLKYTEEEGKLTYDTNNLFGVMLSAMQAMANKIESLEVELNKK